MGGGTSGKFLRGGGYFFKSKCSNVLFWYCFLSKQQFITRDHQILELHASCFSYTKTIFPVNTMVYLVVILGLYFRVFKYIYIYYKLYNITCGLRTVNLPSKYYDRSFNSSFALNI